MVCVQKVQSPKKIDTIQIEFNKTIDQIQHERHP